MKNKGYTLIELLCVLGTIAVLTGTSVPIIRRIDMKSRDRTDNSTVQLYNQAMENYRFNDYSVLVRTPVKRVTFEENGHVKLNSSLNTDSDDLTAFKNSGKGIYPGTLKECIAAIKIYTGESYNYKHPSKGSSYDFYYNKITGTVSVLRISDIPIGLRGDYITLEDGE